MEKYRRKTVGEELEEASAENEIRIATHGKIKNYVANVLNLLKVTIPPTAHCVASLDNSTDRTETMRMWLLLGKGKLLTKL